MNNIIYLSGKSLSEDKSIIQKSIEEQPVFVFTDTQTELYRYIDTLHDDYELANSILNRFRVCKEIKFNRNVTLASDTGEELCKSDCMSSLLKEIELDKKYSVVIENDDRTMLANIVQQFVYIEFPITEIDFKLRKEYKDAAKTKLFTKYIDILDENAVKAIEAFKTITYTPNDKNIDELARIRAESIAAYENIHKQILKAKDVEMRIAVAASKKTGKSVIVNCMLGMEIAPTSLLMATPNSCIYRKSSDSQFHLTYNNKKESYAKLDEIHNVITKEFKKAEENKDGKYTIPDMEIDYVSDKNNFGAYTIYDTPGPDFAGSLHVKPAEEAIDICDVAIFAIDYTKYLTNSEEEYLRLVKEVFTKKQKFHTLIFVINKLDQALSDNGVKSRIHALDFIRNRLREIDKNYKDCVIFATSALDYFSTLELISSAEKYPEIQELLDENIDWDFSTFGDIQKKLRSKGDDRLNQNLTYIGGEFFKIQGQLGYNSVNINTIQNYSGMPQLMDYVAYIAQSKAREEIVNSITFEIDSQVKALQAIISNIQNIEKLMNKTQDEIERISEIIEAYIKDVEEVLSHKITKDDSESGKKNKAFAKLISDNGYNYPLDLKKMLDSSRNKISYNKKDMIKDLWESYVSEQIYKIKSCRSEYVEIEQLELRSYEVEHALSSCIKENVEYQQMFIQKNIEDIKNGLINISNNRMERLAECTEECRIRLQKEDCELQLPELPDFDVSLPDVKMPDVGNIIRGIDISGNLRGIFKQLNPVHQFCRNFLNMFRGKFDFSTKEVKKTNISDDEIRTGLSGGYQQFENSIDRSGLWEILNQAYEQLRNNVKEVETEVLANFDNANYCFRNSINDFKNKIDDRDHYKAEYEKYEEVKKMILKIQDNSKDFSESWKVVLTGNER